MKTNRFHRFAFATIFISIFAALIAIIIAAAGPAFATTNANTETKRAVPFSEVEVNGGFMRDYMKLVICKVIPTAIANVEKQNGGIDNIKNCALWHKGGEKKAHEGALYVDSDVHKVLESMCMALDTPDGGDQDIINAKTTIKAKLEKWIPWYQDAPEPNKEGVQYPGYFDTYWSLDEGYTKYSNVDNHELYCQGHFMEAAVAHYRYTQHAGQADTRLLDVAINSADHIVKTFGKGENQRKQMPGHQEIELALMKLAKLCKEIGGTYATKADGYIDKAEFFLEVRGDYEGRTADIAADRRIYYQDLAPVSQQTTAVGHAVRAQYMYTGMCELATIKPEYATKYNNALTSLWDDVTNKKQYVTGGIGDSVKHNEGFEDPYKLPNYSSYCETCAGVANMLWNRSMSTLYDGSQYADQIETDLYNNVLGCINFDGNKFYYENRTCTIKGFDRSTWFGTACCPPNYTRTILQTGGYIYNTTSNDIFVNQFISNKAKFKVGDNEVNVAMQSNLPYEGNGSITVKPTTDANFNLQLRKPSWSNNYSIKVNGTPVTPQIKDGYLVISGITWSSSGTSIDFNFDMPLQYIKSHPLVTSNNGLATVRRGPLCYCAEECDNNFDINNAFVNPGGQFTLTKVDSLDGKANPYEVRTVYILEHSGKAFSNCQLSDVKWKLIPYYARCNRDLGMMRVLLRDGSVAAKLHAAAVPSASYTSEQPLDSVHGLNECSDETSARWTSYKSNSEVVQKPSVQYDFGKPIKINGVRIWWYDDGGGVRRPDDVKITVSNNQTGQQEIIDTNKDSAISVANDDPFTTITFDKTYEGTTIKMEIINTVSAKAAGIVEWELLDAVGNVYSDIAVTKLPNKTEYNVGEYFNPAGMTVGAVYKDQIGQPSQKEVTGYTCTPEKFEKAGEQEVLISYTEGGDTSSNSTQNEAITKTTTVKVNVLEPVNPKPSDNPSGEDANPASSSATGDAAGITALVLLVVLAIAGSTLLIRRKWGN